MSPCPNFKDERKVHLAHITYYSVMAIRSTSKEHAEADARARAKLFMEKSDCIDNYDVEIQEVQ